MSTNGGTKKTTPQGNIKKLEMSGKTRPIWTIYLDSHTLLKKTASTTTAGNIMYSWYTPTLESSNSTQQMKNYVIIVQFMPM